jgi:hypothetical protein
MGAGAGVAGKEGGEAVNVAALNRRLRPGWTVTDRGRWNVAGITRHLVDIKHDGALVAAMASADGGSITSAQLVDKLRELVATEPA